VVRRVSVTDFGRLSAWGEEGRELCVAGDHPKVITQTLTGTAMWERGTGDGSRCGRNILVRGRAERHEDIRDGGTAP
jgi:hypothetical protein